MQKINNMGLCKNSNRFCLTSKYLDIKKATSHDVALNKHMIH